MDARWVDHHAAVCEERVLDSRTDVEKKDQGSTSCLQTRNIGVQGTDPRGLPKHRFLRPGCLRDRSGCHGLLQQADSERDVERRRGSGRDHEQSRTTQPRRKHVHTSWSMAVRPRRNARSRVDYGNRVSQRSVPRDRQTTSGQSTRRSNRTPVERCPPGASRTRCR